MRGGAVQRPRRYPKGSQAPPDVAASSSLETSPKAPKSNNSSNTINSFRCPYRIRKRGFLLFTVLTVIAILSMGGVLEKARRFVIRRIRILGQSSVWIEGWTVVSPGSHKTWLRAKNYYEQQLPLIRAAAQNYTVHSYFAEVGDHVTTPDVGWYEIIGFRAKTMARALEEDGRNDFRVEKDKCSMLEFFQNNQFPMPPVLKVWRNKGQAKYELEKHNEHLLGSSKFPVFLKCCHLTQGSSKSTIPLPSIDYVNKQWPYLNRWIDTKWAYRSDDWERPWAADMNKLTDSLVPGVLIQAPFEIPKGAGLQFMELKVEVLYGRAYLAVANEPYKGTIVTRDGVIETYPSLKRQITNDAVLNPEETKWVQEEGHLPKVWALAERAAKIMAVDEVRIDIFIRRGDPVGLAINENSLSSGMGYRMHFNFMSKVWAQGHLERWYKTYSSEIPVYMHTEVDSPNFDGGPVAGNPEQDI
mmetsp:Transcript_34013/g.66227  ORF Transcript_34013/g.66227 Transcript_34013/m.66227 type:complete len:470 (-) Transcript_34013:141-1550(-)